MKYFHPLKDEIKKNEIKSREMFEDIRQDFHFYKKL
jgi:abortive infection bacteriophage resistance protein